MAGIAGFMGVGGEDLLIRMTAALKHRGPQGAGYHSEGDIHLGVCRLGTIDAGSGDQPVYNEGRDKCVACDGEILNHKDIRQRLEKKGHTFRTGSDIEAVIHLYEERGDGFVEELKGKYALAMVCDDTLILARDRLGVKPLYYILLRDESLLLFASEVKALLRCGLFTPEIDEEKLTDLIVPRYPVGNGTFLKGIKSLLPGHLLKATMRDGQVRVEEKRFCSLSLSPDHAISLDQAEERLLELLTRSVETSLESCGEVGLALSGGLDSTILALIAQKYRPEGLTTFTVSGSYEHQDVKMARVISGQIKSDHKEFIITFEDYLNSIPHYMWAMERPVLGLGVPFYLLCREVSRSMNVLMIGEGADVLFGGNNEYLDGRFKVQNLKRGISRTRELGLPVRDEVLSIVTDLCQAGGFDEYLNNLFRINLADSLAAGFHYYDSCSMTWAVELRDPYFYDDLVDFLNRVPVHLKVNRDLLIHKYLLKHMALERFGTPVIDAVLRQKKGLGFSCAEHTAKFDEMCESNLADGFLDEHPFGIYFSKKRDLLLFDIFKLIFIDNRGDYPSGLDIVDFLMMRSVSHTVR